ncbi:HsdR family type I site-specific deoxyribonuclease [candidate division WOR-3 bacterium]|nr:HsdR family type I site-specific deoxyribonuclease [candidate division WOR-3 bacterium]
MSDKFSEKTLIEDYVVEQLVKLGWQCILAEQLERESYEEPLLVSALVRCIQKINTDSDIGDDEISKVLNGLKLVTTGQEGAKKIMNFFKFGVPVKFEKERVIKYVQLFDYGAPSPLRLHSGQAFPSPIKGEGNNGNNEFVVSRQVTYSGREKIRTDIMLYVNGIPLVNIECKDPTKAGVSWYDAFTQIKDYENIVPELYKYVQIGVAVESKARYFPIVPWQDKDTIRTHQWREEHDQENIDEIDDQIAMLSPERLLDIVKNFLFARVEMGNATKVITRYMQYRAANRIVKRVLDKIDGQEEKDKGLIWHWQGSGKTLTMIFAAHKLYYDVRLENPSIFFVVDRIELEEQLYTEFYALDIMRPEIVQSVVDLQDVLSYDENRGKRGIFITLIHKFRHDELERVQSHLEHISTGRPTIMTRKNVIAFVDEGHRSQYGMLAAQMKAILKNAFFFALTGTPISKPKHGRDTYLEFAYPPDERYLDRYFIVDSILDGFTVKIVYQPRLEKDVHLRKEMLEAFLDVELDEIPEYARSEVEAKLKQRLNPINVFLENKERIERIAADIAQHFRENVKGDFKALIVAASRKACVYYKNALEKHIPRNYFDVVMTSERDDEDVIYGYVREARERYDGKDYKSTLKNIIEKYKENDYPKILIVTDMLLTGFDAPRLQVMYLDKPLKEHRLLQAIARTNRPYKGIKEAGIIIDYVGILKEFKRAFELYSKEDMIDNALYDFDSIRTEFDLLMSEIAEIFDGLAQSYERETLLKAVEILTTDVSREDEFIEKYRRLRKVFELLGADPCKLEYFELYKWISAVYTYYMKMVMRGTSIDAYVHKYYDKTLKYIYKSTEIEKIEQELPQVTFDAQSLKTLEDKVKSTEEKAANILFTLQRFVLVDKQTNPVYESLVDRVQRLVELWRAKTKDYERIYKEGVDIFSDIETLKSRQHKLGLTDLEYAIFLAVEGEVPIGDEFAEKIKALAVRLDITMFPGWAMQATAQKAVEQEVRKFVRQLKAEFKLDMKKMDDLYNRLITKVADYGS